MIVAVDKVVLPGDNIRELTDLQVLYSSFNIGD
jgi:hypothetical protein